MFGFSRGAYTARSAGRHDRPGRPAHPGRTGRRQAARGRRALPAHATGRGRVRRERRRSSAATTATPTSRSSFLGVFDTVGALGVPGRAAAAHRFHDVNLSNGGAVRPAGAGDRRAPDEVRAVPVGGRRGRPGTPTRHRAGQAGLVRGRALRRRRRLRRDRALATRRCSGWRPRRTAGPGLRHPLLATYMGSGSTVVRHDSLKRLLPVPQPASRGRMTLTRKGRRFRGELAAARPAPHGGHRAAARGRGADRVVGVAALPRGRGVRRPQRRGVRRADGHLHRTGKDVVDPPGAHGGLDDGSRRRGSTSAPRHAADVIGSRRRGVRCRTPRTAGCRAGSRRRSRRGGLGHHTRTDTQAGRRGSHVVPAATRRAGLGEVAAKSPGSPRRPPTGHQPLGPREARPSTSPRSTKKALAGAQPQVVRRTGRSQVGERNRTSTALAPRRTSTRRRSSECSRTQRGGAVPRSSHTSPAGSSIVVRVSADDAELVAGLVGHLGRGHQRHRCRRRCGRVALRAGRAGGGGHSHEDGGHHPARPGWWPPSSWGCPPPPARPARRATRPHRRRHRCRWCPLPR